MSDEIVNIESHGYAAIDTASKYVQLLTAFVGLCILFVGGGFATYYQVRSGGEKYDLITVEIARISARQEIIIGKVDKLYTVLEIKGILKPEK